MTNRKLKKLVVLYSDLKDEITKLIYKAMLKFCPVAEMHTPNKKLVISYVNRELNNCGDLVVRQIIENTVKDYYRRLG